MSKTIKVSNGDWAIDSRGRPIYIDEREKCAQDVAHVMLSELTDDATWGSELHKVEQGVIVDTVNAHKSLVQNLVTEAVERLITKQELEEDIPEEEKIASFNVTVERLPHQALSYAFFLSVLTEASDDPIEQPFVIELEHVRDPNLEDIVPFAGE